jgi:hypothetical protein
MKDPKISVPLALTAAITSVIILNSGCGKNPSAVSNDAKAKPASGQNNAVNSNTNVNGTNVVHSTNSIATAAAGQTVADGSNSTALATPEIAPTAPAENAAGKTTAGKITTIEMAANPPVPPKNFYPKDFSTNHVNLFDSSSDYYFAARGGYEHSGYGNNRDTWYLGITFYAQPDNLRAQLGKNAWLIPDAVVEFSHQALPRPENSTIAGDGIQLRADIYWNWIKWTTHAFARENSACVYARPWTFAFGPLVETGFEKTFEGSAFRADRYFGGRFSINRYAFVQYTFGKTDGFGGVRENLLGELPISISHDSQVRYVLRGEWERGDRNYPSFYEAGIFVEAPLGLLARPREWRDLIPFVE